MYLLPYMQDGWIGCEGCTCPGIMRPDLLYVCLYMVATTVPYVGLVDEHSRLFACSWIRQPCVLPRQHC